MTDPFRTVGIRRRIIAAGALALVAGLIVAVSYLRFGMPITDGREVQAEVLRVGTRPAARFAGGDLPVLTVRVPDGSVREVLATWPDINGCKPGRWISLLEDGTALQVGRPGCPARPKVSCPAIGHQIGETAVHITIFGDVGQRAEIGACPGVTLHFGLTVEEPSEYRQLEQRARERHEVLGLSAVGDGYIVQDRGGERLLVLDALNDVREDPSVAAYFHQTTKRLGH